MRGLRASSACCQSEVLLTVCITVCHSFCSAAGPHRDSMVLIIDGEIVPDNDPRAIARRKPASTGSASRPSSGANISGIPQANSGARAPAQAGRAGPAGGSPLDALADAMGIGGMSVTVPRLHARLPAREVPMVAAGLVGLLTMFFGWRVLAGCALMHCFAGFSETAPQAPPTAGRPGSSGGGGPIGGGGVARR